MSINLINQKHSHTALCFWTFKKRSSSKESRPIDLWSIRIRCRVNCTIRTTNAFVRSIGQVRSTFFPNSSNLIVHHCCAVASELKYCQQGSSHSLFHCKSGHVMLSTPHFLYDTDALVDQVDGLDPRPEAHETLLDIEPVKVIWNGFWCLKIDSLLCPVCFSDDRFHGQSQQTSSDQHSDSKWKPGNSKFGSHHRSPSLGRRGVCVCVCVGSLSGFAFQMKPQNWFTLFRQIQSTEMKEPEAKKLKMLIFVRYSMYTVLNIFTIIVGLMSLFTILVVFSGCYVSQIIPSTPKTFIAFNCVCVFSFRDAKRSRTLWQHEINKKVR